MPRARRPPGGRSSTSWACWARPACAARERGDQYPDAQQVALLLEARALRAAPPPEAAARRRELQLLELSADALPNILASAYDLARVDGAAWQTLATDLIVRGVASPVADERAAPGSPSVRGTNRKPKA